MFVCHLRAHGQSQEEVDSAGADEDLEAVLRPLGLLVQHEGHEGLDTAVYDRYIDTIDRYRI